MFIELKTGKYKGKFNIKLRTKVIITIKFNQLKTGKLIFLGFFLQFFPNYFQSLAIL